MAIAPHGHIPGRSKGARNLHRPHLKPDVWRTNILQFRKELRNAAALNHWYLTPLDKYDNMVLVLPKSQASALEGLIEDPVSWTQAAPHSGTGNFDPSDGTVSYTIDPDPNGSAPDLTRTTAFGILSIIGIVITLVGTGMALVYTVKYALRK